MEEITVIKVEAQGWPTLPGYVHCTFLAKVGLLEERQEALELGL